MGRVGGLGQAVGFLVFKWEVAILVGREFGLVEAGMDVVRAGKVVFQNIELSRPKKYQSLNIPSFDL